MRRISSGSTFFYKRVFPIIWFGMTGVFLFFGIIGSIKGAEPPLVLVPLVVMIIAGLFVFKKLLFDLVDQVWDDGDALIVRNKNDEERIPLSQIINISDSFLTNPPRITLTVREPTRFGKEIAFMPPMRFLNFLRSPIARELIERVDEARRSQV
jgi:hypothetical protein